MEVYVIGKAIIKHKKTKELLQIECTELDFDMVGSDERKMGSENHYQASIEKTNFGVLTWNVREYPVGIENHKDTDCGEHELLEDFDYGLRHVE